MVFELPLPDRTRIKSMVLEQEPDSCETSNDIQELSIRMDDAGGGHFCRLSTERWSVDDPEAFAQMLRQLAAQCDAWTEEILNG